MSKINISLGQKMSDISGLSEQISQGVTEAIRSLQFEDITTQSLSIAARHIERLLFMSSELALLRQDDTLHAHDEQQWLHLMRERIRSLAEEWRKNAHKPVEQLSMASGEIELF